MLAADIGTLVVQKAVAAIGHYNKCILRSATFYNRCPSIFKT